MKKNKKSFSVKPVILLSAAALLLLGSTVGSTRAALTYYSENYSAQINTSNIGVSLVENGETVSYRDFTEEGAWSEGTGTLLGGLLDEANGEKLVLGKNYSEELSVRNSGSIDSYVRVILYKSWADAQGNKATTLSPDLIRMNLGGSGWVEDTNASTKERTILYYTGILPAGETTPAFTDTVSIDPALGKKVTQNETIDGNGNKTITTVYDYNGYNFHVEAEVNAVQTHNAQEAIKSAWGVDVNVADDGSISLR